jgi:tRNA pseudouridine(55) synthase
MQKDNREVESGVYLVNKKIGETPLEAINRFRLENKKENPELDFLPITYAGRLDPMAEGLLLLLVGEKAKEKDKYLNLPKVYEFEILWGVETDTLDLLGLVSESSKVKVKTKIPDTEEIQKYLENSKGKFQQMYPAFSSRPVGGKPLFEWAREGKINEVDLPKHEVEIFSAKFVERKEFSKNKLQEEILSRINTVKGDFRQQEIKTDWVNYLNDKSSNFIVDKVQVEVSSGFYVRQFVSDMARYFESLGITFSIKRLRIKEFSL